MVRPDYRASHLGGADASLLVPQLVALAFLLVAVAYVQLVLTPTARIKFDAAGNDEQRRRVRELLDSDDDERATERAVARALVKPIPRPRGDQVRLYKSDPPLGFNI